MDRFFEKLDTLNEDILEFVKGMMWIVVPTVIFYVFFQMIIVGWIW